MTNPYPTVSSKIRAIEEWILRWTHDHKGPRFPHAISWDFDLDYEPNAKEREAMYQDEQKEHLESFREGVLNIMGVSLLKEASKDAIQICNLASNPVRFIPTRNSSPDLPAPGPVSEGATLPKACILEPPQRNTQLVSDTSSVQPELPSAAPLDFDDVESHLGNSDKRKASNPPSVQPQPKRLRTAATHPSKDRQAKSHREPAESQENRSSAATRQSDTSDLVEAAMTALGYIKESTQAETILPAPAFVRPHTHGVRASQTTHINLLPPIATNLETIAESLSINPENPLECPECGQGFRRREHVKRHIDTVHKEGIRIECKVEGCGKLFCAIRRDNWRAHLELHINRDRAEDNAWAREELEKVKRKYSRKRWVDNCA